MLVSASASASLVSVDSAWHSDTSPSCLKVNRLANALRDMGVQKGDRVAVFMAHVPENCIAMLACARIGAIHSVVFGGFSKEALSGNRPLRAVSTRP